MSRRTKILLVLGLIALLGAAALSGLVFHYSSNPSKLKHLAENALSGLTGAECSITEISYSKKPLTVRFMGIKLVERPRGFHIEIPEISAVISLEGRLGRRTLVFQDLRVNGFTLKRAEAWSLPLIARDAGDGSLGRRLLGRLFSFFLFNDVEVHKAGLINGHMAGKWGDRTISVDGLYANLTPERFLEAGCGVRIRSDSEGIDLRIPRLKWISSHPIYPPGPAIRATMKGEDITLETPRGEISSAALQTTMLFNRPGKTLDFESFRMVSDETALEVAESRLSFSCVVEARAGMDLRKATLTMPSLRVALGDMAEFKGEVHARFTGDQEAGIKAGDLRIMPENIIPMLPGSIKGGLEGAGLAGPIHASGRVTGSLKQPWGQWICDLEARLRENEISFSSPGSRLRAALSGNLQMKGPVSDPRFHMNMSADKSEARLGALEINKGRLGLSVTGAYPAFRVDDLTLHAASAAWKRGERPFALEAIQGRGRSGSFDVKKMTFSLPELALTASGLKDLVFALEATEEEFSADAQGEAVQLVALAGAMGFLPRGWEITSTESLQGRVVLGKEGRLAFSAKLEIRGLSFESEDGALMGENISFVLESAFEGNTGPQGKLGGAASFSAGKGEILYDRFYLDLGRHPLSWNAKGDYAPAAGALDVSGATLRLEELATLSLKGASNPDRPETALFLVHVPRAPLKPIFRQFIVEPYKHQNPTLSELHLGGFFSLNLELSRQDSLWTVKGRSLWHEGEASTEGQGILLKGIELDLPIWYRHGAKSAAPSASLHKTPVELEGSLSIQSLHLPLLPAQPLRTPLKAGPDRFYTADPIALITTGGQIDIGRILFREPFSRTPAIETSLTLKQIDLKPWLSAVWPGPVEGSARGKLDPVQWQGDTLAAQGEITARLFDGQLIVSNVGAKRFPSLTPVITFDAAWTDLDLAQLTGGTAFGKIQGNLRGRVKGLEIADGQPQAFDLFMETVKKREVPQRISVQAVDNIARIGGGASPFTGLAGAFVSFFRELPYEKIGISAVLENDLFRINGTIRENDKEYLIKKGGFSGVDVIIGTPGSNTISFKDMVRRIKRVGTSQEGPVIE